MKIDIGKKIAQFRKEKGLTQGELAERIGVTIAHLGKIEIGIKSPTLATLNKICEELDCTLLMVKSSDVTP